MNHNFKLMTINDIEIRFDYSVAIIFFLIIYSLGNGVFNQWHPDWSAAQVWSSATISGLLFFVSLLLHELSHALVAQKMGIAVPRITLFLFGGMAEMSRDPDRPKVEFLIAIAGPLMSVIIGLFCTYSALWLINDAVVAEAVRSGQESGLSQMAPLPTVLLWLGTINLVLALFNLVPGFPMDGGRVFRAIAWSITNDKLKSTRWASNMGQYFGWFLMSAGIVRFFGGGGLGAIWWILIGWFLSVLAANSYKQVLSDQRLHGMKVADVMRTRFAQVPGDMALNQFIDEHLLRSSQQLWPVTENSKLAGFVSLPDLAGLSTERRRHLTVKDVMNVTDAVESLNPDSPAMDALQSLAGKQKLLPVVHQEKVVGLIQHGDILKWIALHTASQS